MRQFSGTIIKQFASREFGLFVGVGLAQFLWDSVLFSVLHWWSGQLVLSNVVARGSAAMLGFMLNRSLTFAQARSASALPQFLRLLMLWGVLTLSSTVLLAVWREAGEALLAPEHSQEWLMPAGKVLVEMLLVLSSFWAAKNWVYR